jgi:hypothetical protein
MLNHGTLPRICLAERPRPLLNAYVADYLKDRPQFLLLDQPSAVAS